MALQNFTITQLAASVGCFNGFVQVGGQHVARNSAGTFYIVELAPAQVSAGTPNSFQLYRDTGSGPSVVWSSGSIPTNQCCVEVLATGEVYVIYADFTSNFVYVVYFAATVTWSGATTPTTTLQITAAGSNGKLGTVMDERRRQLFIAGNAGQVFRVSDIATLLGRQTVFAPVTDAPQYCAPVLDTNGYLYLLLCNSNGIPYDAITVALCVNPGDIGGTINGAWTAYPWVGPSTIQLSLPVDPGFNGPMNYITSGEQNRNYSSLLTGAAVRGGRLRATIAQGVANLTNPFWDRDDMAHCSTQALTSRWQGPPLLQANANIQFPLRDNLVFPRAASGGVVLRAPGDFIVSHDRNSLVAMKSTDFGKSYTAYAQTALPSLGTDTPHYVTLFRGLYTDTDIIGMCTVLHCTPSQWSTGTCPVGPAYAANNPTATGYYFTLPVS